MKSPEITEPEMSLKTARIILAAVLACFSLCEIVIPPFVELNFRPDILEQIMIGKEWVIGSLKHPALTTWIARIFWECGNHSDFAPYCASTLCIMVSLVSLWILSREFISPLKSLFATLSMMAYWYFNMGSTMYNNNLTLMMFWSLAILFFYFALKKNRLRYWILTGVSLGLALNCKYTAIELVLAMVLYLLIFPQVRSYWKTRGPWICTLAAFLIFLPNMIFLYCNFSTIYGYTSKGHSVPDSTFLAEYSSRWLIQLLIISPVVLSLFPLLRFPIRRNHVNTGVDPTQKTDEPEFNASFLLGMFFIPMLIQIVLSFLSGIEFRTNSYGFPLWWLTGLMILYFFETTPKVWHWKLSAFWIVLCSILQILGYVVNLESNHLWRGVRHMCFFPGKAVAQTVDEIWAEHYPKIPCPYVTAGKKEGYFSFERHDYICWNGVVYSRFQPTILSPIGPWFDDEKMKKEGGIILWECNDSDPENEVPPYGKERFPNAVFVCKKEIPYLQRNPQVPKLQLGCAIVPPEEKK